MLQQKKLNREAHDYLSTREPFPPKWTSHAELEEAADRWMANWLHTRQTLAKKKNRFVRIAEALDRAIRTDKIELIDDPRCPDKTKQRIVKGVHFLNVINRAYSLFARTLTPLIEDVARRQGRPARLLELASGSGEQAMALAEACQKQALPVTITGSDYIPLYIADANARAKARDVPVTFELINAFDMKDISENTYDIILICGSTHHFTPGQMAMMIAQSTQVATTAFISIDARRGIDNLLAIVPLPLLTFQFGLLHDAWISGRKFYTQYELEHIAEIAAPNADISTLYIGSAGFLGCMTVRFNKVEEASAP